MFPSFSNSSSFAQDLFVGVAQLRLKGREADYDIEDGKSNFLEGAMLIGMYAVIALAFVSYHNK